MNCQNCKRTLMLDHSVFANGYTDDGGVCHACKQERNRRITEDLEDMARGEEQDREYYEYLNEFGAI